MLWATSMVPVRILCLDRSLRAVMTALAAMKVVHLTADTPEGFASLVIEEAGAIADAERRLRRLLPEPRPGRAETPQILLHEAFEPTHEITARLDELDQLLEPLRKEEQRFREELAGLQQSVQFLEPLEAAGLNPPELGDPRFVALLLGFLPAEGVDKLKGALAGTPHALEVEHAEDGRVRLWLAVAKQNQTRIRAVLDTLYFSSVTIPEADSLCELLDEDEEEVWRIREEMAAARASAGALMRRWTPSLRRMEMALSTRRQMARSLACLAHSDRTYLVSGWVPSDRTGDVEETVNRFPPRQVAMLEGEPGSDPPAEFRRPRWLEPFASLVEGFGHASYRNIDPAPFTALSFLVLFGMMFADVGHGALLVLIGLLVGRFGRPRWKGAGWLLGMTGASAALFGVLFGSLFGLQGVIPAVWFHPFSDVQRLMQLALITGVAILSLGFVLSIAQSLRARDRWGALFGSHGLAGLLFYWGAVGLVIFALRGAPPPVPWGVMVACVLAMLVVAALVPTIRAGGESPLEASAGVLELVISLLANSLSFLRVAAFHLSHAGLCIAVFSLAGELARVVPSRGLSLSIVVEGQLVIILLEGLVVSIQCLRLNYYEFFSRFFRGDGTAYRPFGVALVEGSR